MSERTQRRLSDGRFRRDNVHPHVASRTESFVRWGNSTGSSRQSLNGFCTSKFISSTNSSDAFLQKNSMRGGSLGRVGPLSLNVVKCVATFVDRLTYLSTDRVFSLGNSPGTRPAQFTPWTIEPGGQVSTQTRSFKLDHS